MKFSLRFLLLLVTVVAILIFVGLFLLRFYQQHAGVTLNGVSPQAANRYLPTPLALPRVASDIHLYVDFGAAESEFAISEDAFLAWCNSRGWTVKPISVPTTYLESMWLPADTRSVERGYTFSPPDGNGVFDAEHRRAAFWTSSFP